MVITPLAAFAVSAIAGERLDPTASVDSGEVADDDGEGDVAACEERVPVELTGAGEVSSVIVLSLGAAVLGLVVVDVTAELLVLAAVAPEILLSGV